MTSVEELAVFFQRPTVKATVVAHLIEQSKECRRRKLGKRGNDKEEEKQQQRQQQQRGGGRVTATGTRMRDQGVISTHTSRALSYFLQFIGLALTFKMDDISPKEDVHKDAWSSEGSDGEPSTRKTGHRGGGRQKTPFPYVLAGMDPELITLELQKEICRAWG